MKKLICIILVLVLVESVYLTASASANFSPAMFVASYNQFCSSLLGNSATGAQLSYVCDVDNGILGYANTNNYTSSNTVSVDILSLCYATSQNSSVEELTFECPIGYNTSYSNIPMFIATSAISYNALGYINSAFTMWPSDYFSGEGGDFFCYCGKTFNCYATLTKKDTGSAFMEIYFNEARTNHPNEFHAAHSAADKAAANEGKRLTFEAYDRVKQTSGLNEQISISCTMSGDYAAYDYNGDLLFAFPAEIQGELINIWIVYDFDSATAYPFVSEDNR